MECLTWSIMLVLLPMIDLLIRYTTTHRWLWLIHFFSLFFFLLLIFIPSLSFSSVGMPISMMNV